MDKSNQRRLALVLAVGALGSCSGTREEVLVADGLSENIDRGAFLFFSSSGDFLDCTVEPGLVGDTTVELLLPVDGGLVMAPGVVQAGRSAHLAVVSL